MSQAKPSLDECLVRDRTSLERLSWVLLLFRFVIPVFPLAEGPTLLSDHFSTTFPPSHAMPPRRHVPPRPP
jgi:hypothetical protein